MNSNTDWRWSSYENQADDRFALPKPFCRACVIAGPPIPPPTGTAFSAVSEFRREIEAAMLEVTRRAEYWRERGQFLREPYPQDQAVRKAG